MTMQDVIYFLQTVGSSNIKVTALENENTRLKQEIKSQILRNEELEKKLEKLEKQSHTVQEDYETLMNIMNRARKLAVMDDEERSQTSFRMDRNGNLEKSQNKRMHCMHPFYYFTSTICTSSTLEPLFISGKIFSFGFSLKATKPIVLPVHLFLHIPYH